MRERKNPYKIEIPEQYDEQLISQIAELERKTFADAWSKNSIIGTLKQDYNFLIIVMEHIDGGTDVSCVHPLCRGYLLADKVAGESELLRIAIEDSCRGLGLGKMLMERYFEELRGDCEKSILEVRDGNTVARGLYEYIGYKAISIRKKYYQNPEEDGIIYEKLL